jgi:hypothetical protein
MNKMHTDTHMQKPDHTRLPTYTHTHMNTHKNMRAYMQDLTELGAAALLTAGLALVVGTHCEVSCFVGV